MTPNRKFTNPKVKIAMSGFYQRQQERNAKKEERKPKMSKYYHEFYKELIYGNTGT